MSNIGQTNVVHLDYACTQMGYLLVGPLIAQVDSKLESTNARKKRYGQGAAPFATLV